MAVDLGAAAASQLRRAHLSEGVHTVKGCSGEFCRVQVTSEKNFEVDLTPPGGASIQLIGDDNVLTSTEIASATTVFITPEPGSTVPSASIGSQNLTYDAASGSYTFNASNLRGGRYEIEATSSDTAEYDSFKLTRNHPRE